MRGRDEGSGVASSFAREKVQVNFSLSQRETFIKEKLIVDDMEEYFKDIKADVIMTKKREVIYEKRTEKGNVD
jgi:hypothetical protein